MVVPGRKHRGIVNIMHSLQYNGSEWEETEGIVNIMHSLQCNGSAWEETQSV
jgi:hypothetical protein